MQQLVVFARRWKSVFAIIAIAGAAAAAAFLIASPPDQHEYDQVVARLMVSAMMLDGNGVSAQRGDHSNAFGAVLGLPPRAWVLATDPEAACLLADCANTTNELVVKYAKILAAYYKEREDLDSTHNSRALALASLFIALTALLAGPVLNAIRQGKRSE